MEQFFALVLIKFVMRKIFLRCNWSIGFQLVQYGHLYKRSKNIVLKYNLIKISPLPESEKIKSNLKLFMAKKFLN